MVAKVARLICCTFLLFSVSVGLFCKPAAAEGITLISDAETQNFLAEIIRPLYRAAGVNFDARKIFIVNDNSLNAFVSDGNYMFVHTGTLLEAQNTNEISGILAHETGHIMGGHIVRQKLKLQKMQYVMLGSMIAAGAAAISTGRGDAAMAVMLGSQSSAINNILHYQTQEERSADESAIKLLAQTKQSTQGLQNFMNKIRKRNALSGIAESPYFRTHPMTAERISHFAEASKNNHFSTRHPLDEKFAMIKAKLSAFLLDKQKVARMYPENNDTFASRYAQSILAFRQNNITKALRLIDELITKQHNNPYFHELKGQFLFESGKIKESVTEYETALKLLPNNYLLQLSLAQALLENNPSNTEVKHVINLLQKSLITEPTPIAWQLLSRAYDMNNQRASSLYAAAEFSYGMDNLEIAKKQLENARKAGADKSLSLKISDLEQRIKDDLKERGF